MGIFDIFKKNGEYIKNFDSGEIYSKELYENGELNGRCVYFYKNFPSFVLHLE